MTTEQELNYLVRQMLPGSMPTPYLLSSYTNLITKKGDQLQGDKPVPLDLLISRKVDLVALEIYLRRRCRRNELSIKSSCLFALMEQDPSFSTYFQPPQLSLFGFLGHCLIGATRFLHSYIKGFLISRVYHV